MTETTFCAWMWHRVAQVDQWAFWSAVAFVAVSSFLFGWLCREIWREQ